ncbi:hypothetical protein EVJ32_05180 [Exiguobacterium sp. SH5S4]|uniref:hypothetical protein n=1 Tax=Exiguobacterium sp. SH5S4 TaxID=2510961 RepID=UPI00103A70B7|nr:hypothetical protein [Exiguobacterium sp. SH5S4]TCI26771.1 hypothetical protein EVJ32_05180 [Exiguobacterium sp. SH5S4]
MVRDIDRLRFLMGKPTDYDGFMVRLPTVAELAQLEPGELNRITAIFLSSPEEIFEGQDVPEEEVASAVMPFIILQSNNELYGACIKMLETFFGTTFDRETSLSEDYLLIDGRPLTREAWDAIRTLVTEINDWAVAKEVEPEFTSDKAREIWMKQQKANAIRAKMNKKDAESFESVVYDMVSAICSKSHSVNHQNVSELNIVQLRDHLTKLIEIEVYELNMMFAAHGADIKDNEHWSQREKSKNKT